jgi:thiol peroxidase
MNTTNKNITFKGGKLTVTGRELKVGDALPPFKLVGNDMKDVTQEDFKGKKLILVVVPSLDTPVCQIEVKKFNEEASKRKDLSVLAVSLDLPFAQKRWCGSEGVSNVASASDYKYRSFGESFGTYIQELGLLARAVFSVNEKGVVTHVEYVPEIAQEPEYDAALRAV